jgi:enoyl-[acyl-carrier protein] reductase II
MTQSNSLSDRFFEKGRQFLGVEYPFLCGAMTWISEPNLVSAVCEAGGMGCLAGGNTPVDVLEKQIEETRSKTNNPFAVNLITIAPVYEQQIDMIEKQKLPVVIFAGSFPRRQEVERVKATGAKVICFASTLSIAKRMVGFGADAIIIEGMEAGGHVGHVSLSVLLQQVLFEFTDVPVFVAGGIASGKMAAHMFLMGASGVQMGTVFAVSKESCAHTRFKDTFIKSNARQAVSTPQYDSRLPVVAVRALRNRAHDDFGQLQLELIRKLDAEQISREEAQEIVENFWIGSLRNAVIEGDVDNGSLMAGQSVGLINDSKSVADIFDDFRGGMEAELKRVKETLA